MADFFPSDYPEALTLLYLQSLDLHGVSPEDLARLYWETYFRVQDAGASAFREVNSARVGKNRSTY